MLNKHNYVNTETVTSKTLSEAFEIIRQQYGSQVHVIECNKIVEKSASGIDQKPLVQVVFSKDVNTDRNREPIRHESIIRQINKIEDYVDNVVLDESAGQSIVDLISRYPLYESLKEIGISTKTNLELAKNFVDYSAGGNSNDAVRQLAGLIKTSGKNWNNFTGQHLFIGTPGAGKTTLILETASKLVSNNCKTVIVSIAPKDKYSVSKIKDCANDLGCEATVLDSLENINACADYFQKFDTVLIDTNDYQKAMSFQYPDSIHKHLVVSAENDFDVINANSNEAIANSFDWMVISRMDLANSPGKVLEITINSDIPVSIIGQRANQKQSVLLPTVSSFMNTFSDRESSTLESAEYAG